MRTLWLNRWTVDYADTEADGEVCGIPHEGCFNDACAKKHQDPGVYVNQTSTICDEGSIL